MLFVFLSYFKFMIKWLNAGTSRRRFCEEHAGNLSHTNETWSTTAVCRIGSSPACCRPTSWFGYRTYTDPRSTFVVCLDIWRRSCPTYTVTLETFLTKMSVAYLCNLQDWSNRRCATYVPGKHFRIQSRHVRSLTLTLYIASLSKPGAFFLEQEHGGRTGINSFSMIYDVIWWNTLAVSLVWRNFGVERKNLKSDVKRIAPLALGAAISTFPRFWLRMLTGTFEYAPEPLTATFTGVHVLHHRIPPTRKAASFPVACKSLVCFWRNDGGLSEDLIEIIYCFHFV